MIRTRGKGVIYGELWFDEGRMPLLPDILICRQRSRPWPGARCNAFKSEFGGVQSRGFDCTVALTWKGRLYLSPLTLRDGMLSAKAPS